MKPDVFFHLPVGQTQVTVLEKTPLPLAIGRLRQRTPPDCDLLLGRKEWKLVPAKGDTCHPGRDFT